MKNQTVYTFLLLIACLTVNISIHSMDLTKKESLQKEYSELFAFYTEENHQFCFFNELVEKMNSGTHQIPKHPLQRAIFNSLWNKLNAALDENKKRYVKLNEIYLALQEMDTVALEEIQNTPPNSPEKKHGNKKEINSECTESLYDAKRINENSDPDLNGEPAAKRARLK